ncbi:MAG: MFS transporter [Gemmataceae bacterium]|nr:MFS transporter [Gemmataceae bacterium]
MSQTPISPTPIPLTNTGRWIILVCAFFGWFFCGFHMQITQLTGQPAAIDLLGQSGVIDPQLHKAYVKLAKNKTISSAEKTQLDAWNSAIGRWFAWHQCAFLFGGAAGGLGFGWLGDRFGRSKAMAGSIFIYSSMAAAASQAQTPEQLWLLWFLACTGVGGMWPNGVALVSEAWSGMSRPALAGAIGTAANIGIFVFASYARRREITPDDWRFAYLIGAGPVILGFIVLAIVPESPKWLAAQANQLTAAKDDASTFGVFQPALLGVTLVAIVLATVPIVGGWGTANWMNPWADVTGAALDPPDYGLKARVNQARAITGSVGSLLGGWIAHLLGRRLTYFLVSLLSLLIAQYMFWFLIPTDATFFIWVAILGFVSGVYFGWLPFCLPELFPTRHRATGAGVGFNFGRIVTACLLFVAGAIMTYFERDYARIGRLTSLLFILGMVFIWFVPDTSKKELAD